MFVVKSINIHENVFWRFLELLNILGHYWHIPNEERTFLQWRSTLTFNNYRLFLILFVTRNCLLNLFIAFAPFGRLFRMFWFFCLHEDGFWNLLLDLLLFLFHFPSFSSCLESRILAISQVKLTWLKWYFLWVLNFLQRFKLNRSNLGLNNFLFFDDSLLVIFHLL